MEFCQRPGDILTLLNQAWAGTRRHTHLIETSLSRMQVEVWEVFLITNSWAPQSSNSQGMLSYFWSSWLAGRRGGSEVKALWKPGQAIWKPQERLIMLQGCWTRGEVPVIWQTHWQDISARHLHWDGHWRDSCKNLRQLLPKICSSAHRREIPWEHYPPINSMACFA